MSLHLPLLGSPQPSSGYGSSEEEQNFLLFKNTDFGSESLGQSFSFSLPTSGLLSPTSMQGSDGSCPVTPDSVTSEIEFQTGMNLFDGDFGFPMDSGLLTGVVLDGYGCSSSADAWIGPSLFDELDFNFERSSRVVEPASGCITDVSQDLASKMLVEESVCASPVFTDSACTPTDISPTLQSCPPLSSPGDSDWGSVQSLNRTNDSSVRRLTSQQSSYNSQSRDVGLTTVTDVRQESIGSRNARGPASSSSSLGASTSQEDKTRTTVRKENSLPVSRSQAASAADAAAARGAVASTHRQNNWTTSSSGNRRCFSQLDDHRYSSSSPHISGPPPKVARLSRPAPEVGARRPPKPTILETLLLTKEPLKANAGSDAMVALSGASDRRHEKKLTRNHHQQQQQHHHHHQSLHSSQTAKSVLEGLLTDKNSYRKKLACDVVQKSTTKTTQCLGSGSLDGYELYSEHLLKDISGKHLGLATMDDFTDQIWSQSQLVFSKEVEDILSQDVQADDLWMHLSDLL